MTEKSDNKGEKSGDKDKTNWPWWGQFLLAVIALSIACVLLIWLPMEMVAKARNDTGNAFTTFIAVLVGLTTMTISGMFLFMTFRIDRGARLTAREEARSVAKKEAREVAEKDTREIAEKEIKGINKRMIENLTSMTEESRKKAVDEIAVSRSRAGVEVAKAEGKARSEVEKAGGEARNGIEVAREKIERDMENIKNEAVNRTNEQVDRLIADARGKIDEADIEKLLNKRIEPILARLADRRGGMFSFRGRNPRS